MNPGAIRSRSPVVAFWFGVLAMMAGIAPAGAEPALDTSETRASKTHTMVGVSERLVRIFRERQRSLRVLSSVATRHGVRTRNGGVLVDVVLRSKAHGIAREILDLGGEVLSVTSRNHRASVVVRDAGTMARIAALPQVHHIYPAYTPVRRVGSVDSRAVAALTVDTVPGGLDGTGQKIGILSDSFARTTDVVDSDDSDGTETTTDGTPIDAAGNSTPVTLRDSRPQQSVDLPTTIELRRDDASGELVDEGAAMAELVHDIAPDAEIVFHTAFVSFGDFAAGIEDLCGAAGSTVVVDDVLYFSELMYQRDVISRAARNCVANGVPYFSSAGNNSDRAFHQPYRDFDSSDNNDSGRPSVFGNDFHDWDPTSGTDNLLRISLDSGEGFSAVLQWNQPALSTPENTSNGPQIDLDLYLFDGAGNILAQSLTDQVAGSSTDGADPIEVIQYQKGSGGPENVFLGIDHWAGSRDDIPQNEGTRLEFRLVFFEQLPDSNAAIGYEYTPSASTMYGHTVADGVVSVGAVPWWEAPAFNPLLGPTTATDPEPFTARGGSLQEHFRPDGSFFRRTRAPQPYLAAVDANNTTFFGQNNATPNIAGEDDGDPNFFGTSAAAPNAAAVAALLLEDDPARAPAEIAAKLMTSAFDVTGRNASAGCDDRTGAGLVDATAAVTASDAAPRARAGEDEETRSGRTVTLDGSTSADDNGIDRFQWTQVAGTGVSLSNPNGAQTSFTAPLGGGTLAFELRVTDAACLSDEDRVSVKVKGGSGGGSFGPLALAVLLWSLFSRSGCARMHRARAAWSTGGTPARLLSTHKRRIRACGNADNGL
ncbi:MAG: S8 family serine peptidase [Halofilum sp. (in: g-proteobacteria)]|nr:S8 family serine peptidase [Halofilum sp. (in: g-proteobacteria)]